MNKNKKRMAKGIAAAALIGVIAVGSTLAYLSANTGTKTNKFTGTDKNITGETTETKFDSTKDHNYTPGDSYNKNPSIKLDANGEPANVALAVDYYGLDVETAPLEDGGYKVTAGTPITQEQFKKYANITGWAIGDSGETWKLIAKSNNGSELYMYNEVLGGSGEGVKLEPGKELFQKINVNAGLSTVTEDIWSTTTKYTFEDSNANGKYDPEIESERNSLKEVDSTTAKENIKTINYVDAAGNTLFIDHLPPIVVDINGYGVQNALLEDNNTTAAAELIKLANVGRTDDDIFFAV